MGVKIIMEDGLVIGLINYCFAEIEKKKPTHLLISYYTELVCLVEKIFLEEENTLEIADLQAVFENLEKIWEKIMSAANEGQKLCLLNIQKEVRKMFASLVPEIIFFILDLMRIKQKTTAQYN